MPLPDYVLATADGRSLFNFYETPEAAQADMARANGKDFADFGPYEPMTYAEYERRNRAFWLSDPAVEITADKWEYALEVLPPMRLEQQPGFNSFLMSEMTSGVFMQQYVRYGYGETARYFTRMVDASDRSTWMKRDGMPETAEGAAE